MEIDYVLTAVDLDPLYVDFIPMFVESWKVLVPRAKIVIILIADYIPPSLMDYEEHLTLYHTPYKNQTGFIG